MSAPATFVATAQDRVVLRAHAKINLALEVLNRRPDGYHDIRSLVMPVELCDRVLIEPAESGIETRTVAADGLDVAPLLGRIGERNLATRAARALQQELGTTAGARITLEKRIPLGGGLGGGSADAAAVLHGLNRLWAGGLDKEGLMRVGARVGADVPALVHGGMVCMEGVGERVTGLGPDVGSQARFWVVLANPGVNVSTRGVYASWRKRALTPPDGSVTDMVCAVREGSVAAVARCLRNGLQDTVFRKYPLIEIVWGALREAGCLGALLCGSGASVFGITADEAGARRVANQIAQRFGNAFWIRVTRTLPDGVMVAHGPLEA